MANSNRLCGTSLQHWKWQQAQVNGSKVSSSVVSRPDWLQKTPLLFFTASGAAKLGASSCACGLTSTQLGHPTPRPSVSRHRKLVFPEFRIEENAMASKDEDLYILKRMHG